MKRSEARAILKRVFCDGLPLEDWEHIVLLAEAVPGEHTWLPTICRIAEAERPRSFAGNVEAMREHYNALALED